MLPNQALTHIGVPLHEKYKLSNLYKLHISYDCTFNISCECNSECNSKSKTTHCHIHVHFQQFIFTHVATCVDPEVLSEGASLDKFFLLFLVVFCLFVFGGWGVLFFKLMTGERIQIPLKVGHHRPAGFANDDGLTLNAGLVALRFFRGSGPA